MNAALPDNAELGEAPQDRETLFRNPSFHDQILVVPADSVQDHKDAGWEEVEDSGENRAKAVPAGRTYRYHFGVSSTP